MTLPSFSYSALDAETRIVVQQKTSEIKSVMRRAAQDIIDIGAKLVEVKDRLGHGKFGEWLATEFQWSEDTAGNFMNVAKRFGDNPKISEFAPSALYLLSRPSTPESAREAAFARAAAGQQVTHSVAKEIVQQHKPASSSTIIRYERDAEDQTPPDNAVSIVYAPPGTPHGYNWTEESQPIIYGDKFYAADHIKRIVIVWPYSSKDFAWGMYPKLNPVPGTNFHTHMGTMGLYAYLTPDEYAAQIASDASPTAPSVTDGIPDAKVSETPTDDIDLDEPDVDDEDTQQLDLPAATPEQLPFDQPEPNDPDPFAGGYEVGPFGRQPIKPKPESKVSAEAGAMIDTATSLRELAASLSNKGTDTPISGWEAGQVDVMQGAKQLYAERQNGEPVPDEQPAQPVGSRQNAINAFTSSETVEWYTPAIYIKSARTVMGDIDLDPATCAEAQATVKARQFFTKETDGLAQKWHGRVWLNPPYGRDEDGESTVAKWVHKVVTAYISREIEQAVILVNNTGDRAWFDELWPFPICVTSKRIKFYGPNNTNGNPTVGNAFVYLGENVPGFVEEFEQYGPINFSTRMFRRLGVELADVFGELFYEAVRE